MFSDVDSQIVDSHGKVRALLYSSGIALEIYPIPPSNLQLSIVDDIKPSPLKKVLSFLKEKDLQIISQGDSKSIKGLWVEPKEENPSIYFGYIPLIETKPIKNIEFSIKNDPIRTIKNSTLKTYKNHKKIANILKQYALYTYAMDPINFGEDSFVIQPNHVYDIEKLNKRFIRNTDVIYYRNKIIVPNEEVKTNLLSYVEACVVNDPLGTMDMKNLTFLDYYETLSDFKSYPRQLIFMNKNGLVRWRNKLIRGTNTNSSNVKEIDPDTLEPYFYRNPRIRKEHIILVQNVEDYSLNRTIAVGYKWIKDKVNIGPYHEEDNKNVSYIIYTENGLENKVDKKTKETVYVIRYNNEKYGALLFFD